MKKITLFIMLLLIAMIGLIGCDSDDNGVDTDLLIGQWKEVEIWKDENQLFLFDKHGNLHMIRIDEYDSDSADTDSMYEYVPKAVWEKENGVCTIELYGNKYTVIELDDERMVATNGYSKAIFERVPKYEEIDLNDVFWYGIHGGVQVDFTEYFG